MQFSAVRRLQALKRKLEEEEKAMAGFLLSLQSAA